MDLNDYLATQGQGAAARLAAALNVSPVLISLWRGRRAVPAHRCPEIERHTGGAVRCEDMRPDIDWNFVRTSAWHEVSAK